MKEWFTAAELAAMALPGLPSTTQGIQARAQRECWNARKNMAGGALARKREGRGGGVEFHYTVLPSKAQAKIAAELAPVKADKSAEKTALASEDLWSFFEALPEKRKARAKACLTIIEEVSALYRGGMQKNLAVNIVAKRHGKTPATIWNWFSKIAGVPRADWLPALAPRNVGRTKTVDCDPDAWAFFKAAYLAPSRRTYKFCYRLMEQAGADRGWTYPSRQTLQRRLEREVAKPVIVLAREGLDALKAMYPAQERDRSVFHALEAVNADGHKWDVMVQWPDEDKPMRPMMVAIQDLYSGKILAWRIDKSENKEAVRLAIGDVIEEYGIFDHIWLDNGRGFASKWLTGGVENRFRFKIKDEEPVGILTQLGVEVHWTLPYSGQSKPIERAFGELCQNIAKHPAFDGSYTGNSPMNKPADYGTRAVPLEEFLRVVESGINEHNQRPGREAKVCRGRSFNETFDASYAQAPVKKATEEQRRLWLLAAEGVTAARRDGAIKLKGNRYWGDFLHGHMGQKLVVRFDPQNLHAGLHVYRLDGSYLGFADVIHAVGFNDAGEAQDHARRRKQFTKSAATLRDLHVKLTGEELDAMLPAVGSQPPIENKVVRMVSSPDHEPLMKRPAPPQPTRLSAEEEAEADLIIAAMAGEENDGAEVVQLQVAQSGRPNFETDEEFARWVLDNPTLADEADRARVGELMSNPSFRLLMGAEASAEFKEKSRRA